MRRGLREYPFFWEESEENTKRSKRYRWKILENQVVSSVSPASGMPRNMSPEKRI